MNKPMYKGKYIGQCVGTEKIKIPTKTIREYQKFNEDLGFSETKKYTVCKTEEKPYWTWDGLDWVKPQFFKEQKTKAFSKEEASKMFRKIMKRGLKVIK